MHSSSYNTDDNRKNCFSITAFSNVICVICYIRHCCTQKHKLKAKDKIVDNPVFVRSVLLVLHQNPRFILLMPLNFTSGMSHSFKY